MAVNPKEIHGIRTEFEHQDNHHFCGPACAVMILGAIKMQPPDQETLFNEINAFQTRDRRRGHENWSSSPDGLTNALNNRSGPNHHFTLYASLSQTDIARRLVNSISIFKAPCITLMESGGHWIVIYQYRKLGSEPTRFDDFLLRDMRGFYKRDPFEEVPSQSFINYRVWQTDNLFSEEFGLWQNKFVAICDPEPDNNKKGKGMPSKKKKVLSGKSSVTLSVSNQGNSDKKENSQDKDTSAKPEANIPKSKIPDSKEPVSKDGDSEKPPPPITRNGKPCLDQYLITENTAKDYTRWHLKTNGFYDREKFSRIINNPQPGEPVLVYNLDTKDFFYITPILENNKQKTGMMRIDAKDARFQEAVFATDIEQPFTFAKLSVKEIKDLLEAKYGKLKEAEPIPIQRFLVWKRCIQSLSRFQPFYMVKMRSKTVYVRIDGKICSQLTQRRRR
jgi:hypothetical protein